MTTRTTFTLTIGGIITAVIALVGTTWRAANAVRDLRDEVAALRRDVSNVANDRWTVADMERWVYRFRWENREKALAVPDVREIKSDRPSHHRPTS